MPAKEMHRIVDLGCGSVPWPVFGLRPQFVQQTARGRSLRPNEVYIGVDHDKAALNMARRIVTAADKSLARRAQFVQADVGAALPFKDESVHEVHAHSLKAIGVTHMLPLHKRAFKEAHRVLKPGGYLIISGHSMFADREKLLEAAAEHFTLKRSETDQRKIARYTAYPSDFLIVMRKKAAPRKAGPAEARPASRR